MSETKFTEGPWLSMVRNDDDAMMSFYGVGIGKSFLPVSTCGNSSNANANLIASAPDLYAEIERDLIEQLKTQKLIKGKLVDDHLNASIIRKQNLLAKARGKL